MTPNNRFAGVRAPAARNRKAYDRGIGIDIGVLQTMRDFNLTDPAVRAKLRQRYGDNVPLNEPVISPVAMFRSNLLQTVAEQ